MEEYGKTKVVVFILVVMIVMGLIIALQFFTGFFPGSNPLNAVDFIELTVLVTPGGRSNDAIIHVEESPLPGDDYSAQ